MMNPITLLKRFFNHCYNEKANDIVCSSVTRCFIELEGKHPYKKANKTRFT